MDQGLHDELDPHYNQADGFNTADWDMDCQQFDLENGELDTMLDKLVDQLPRVPDSNWGKSLEFDDSYIDEWLVDNCESPENSHDSGVYLKSEPLSPSNSLGSSSSYQVSNASVAPSPNSESSIKIESPPITPPQNQYIPKDVQQTDISPNSHANYNKVPLVSSVRKIPLAHGRSGTSFTSLEEEIVNKPLPAVDTTKFSTVEYLQSLETELNQQAALCNRLKSENESLKLKIQQLEQENVALRQHQESVESNTKFSSNKSHVVLFMVLLFVGFNVTVLNLTSSNTVIDQIPGDDSISVLHGRALLSHKGEQPDIIIGRPSLPLEHSKSYKEFESSSSGCSPVLNKTETQRISRTLLKWHQRQKVEYNFIRKNSVLQDKEAFQKLGSNELAIKPDNAIPRKESEVDNNQIVPYYSDVFSSARDYVSKMFNQSVDTFYVVTFKKDLYLYPPTTGNKNQKQRLSLIMPAFNETYMTTMVKIDCEISNMTFVKLNIPSALATDRFSWFQSAPSVL
ncbi:Cyclic AMP-dependent transcription factor ATF-6 beta [Trichoplax sp. H2]|nr:Cyclic AMP-dependent transcription factor ATF-6 beta [Trichoplax sp. H2]|eukprot:RDD45470.1 Cyclic AMP-dependent transcription factor ATF-6 beta [Trichoplax sp. H2]